MAEIANAWISIVPDTSKIAPGVKQALGGVDGVMAQAGAKSGTTFAQKMGKALKAGAIGAGATAGGALAMSFAKGFGRLNSIDKAQAKLKGLGNSAEQVAGIMDNSLKAVKGTAFGLEEAATTSAGLVAAGIKQGKELEQALTTVADVASIAGTSMADMGVIFGSVAARGKLQGDDMLQLTSRGVPVLQMLGEELGKTSAEISEMVSKGQIDFATFERAMRRGVGGSAQEMGKTFSGALANMQAAMGRFGAAMLAPAFAAAPPMFNAIGDSFDAVTSAVKPAAEQIALKLLPASESLGKVLAERVAPKVGAVASAIGELALRFTEMIVDPAAWERIGRVFGRMGEAIGPMVPDIGRLMKAWLTLVGSISTAVWDALVNVLEALAPVLTHVVVPALELIATTAKEHPGLVGALVTAWMGTRVLKTAVSPLTGVANALLKVGRVFVIAKFATEMSKIASATAKTSPVLSSFATMAARLAKAFNPLGAAARFVVSPLKGMLSMMVKMLPRVVGLLNPWVAGIGLAVGALVTFFRKTEVGRELWGKFTGFLASAWEMVVGKLRDGVRAVGEFFAPAFEAIRGKIERVGAWFGGLRDAIADAGGGIRAAFEGFSLDGFVQVLTTALSKVGQVLAYVWDNGFRPVIGWLRDGFGKALGVAGDAWHAYAGAISSKWEQNIAPVVDALRDKFELVRGVVAAAVDWIREQWSGFTSEVSSKYEANIAPMVAKFAAVWQGLQAAIAPALAAIREKWDAIRGPLAEFFQNLWEPVIKPALMLLAGAILLPIVAALGMVAAAVGLVVAAVGGFVYVLVSLPGWVMQAASAVTGWFGDMWANVKNWFLDLGSTITTWWSEHVATLPEKIAGAVEGVKQWFSDMWTNVVTWFREMSQGVADFWLNYVAPLPGQVGDAVQRMLERLKSLPGEMMRLFADAGQWLVSAGQRIINGLWEGMKSAWNNVKNWLSDHLSFSAIGSLVGLSGGGVVTFATGGITEAYVAGGIRQLEEYANGGRRRENHVAQIAPAGAWRVWAEDETGGEAYIPLAASKRLRSTAILDEVAARFGYTLVDRDGVPYAGGYRGNLGPQRVAAFADGGVVGVDELVRLAQGHGASRPLEGADYVFGGSNWGDCSATVSAFAAKAVGVTPFPRKFSTASEGSWLSAHGFMRGRGGEGDLRIGFVNGGPGGGHTAATLPNGVNVEMGGARGNGQYGGQAAGAWDSYFTDFYYLPMAPSFEKVELDGLGDLGFGATSTPTARSASPVTSTATGATGSSPTSISDMAGEVAKATVKGHVADILDVFGVPDTLPSWLTGARDLAKEYQATHSGSPRTSQAEDHAAALHDDAVTSMTASQLRADPQLRHADSFDVVEQPRAPEWGPGFFAHEIARQAKAMGLGADGAKIGVATALVESGDPLKMYANHAVPESLQFRHDAVGSDHDSVGLFQQRGNGAWGTVADRMDAFKSAGMFFAALQRFDWRSMEPGAAAQRVQGSAFPGRYATKMSDADRMVRGTGLYDRGGVLGDRSMALNLSGKPEAILTNEQWKLFRQFAQAIPKEIGGTATAVVTTGLNSVAPGLGTAVAPFAELGTEYVSQVFDGWAQSFQTAGEQAVDVVTEPIRSLGVEMPTAARDALSYAQGAAGRVVEHYSQPVSINVHNVDGAIEAKKRVEARQLLGMM